jgi:hypothetical protein
MKRFKKFTEAKDAYCSDKCCGSDVKAEDCKCPPDCAHCNCNAVSENLEEFTNWSVRHPTKPTKSYKVKARNTGEALKKAHKAAVKAGDLHKQAPSDSMLYKHVKKEEVVEAADPKVGKAVQGLNDLGNKMKGRDQKDIRRIEKLYRSGNKKVFQGAIRALDTDLRDQVMDIFDALGMVKRGVIESVEEGYYSDKDNKQKETLKKHDKRMIKISKDSIEKYEKGKKEETDPTITPAPSAAKADAKRAGVGRSGETYRDRQKRLGKTQTESLSEEQINDITVQYINENNITMAELEAMSPEQLDEFIGKAVGGAFKLGAKAAVGTARLAGKGIKKAANRMSTSGRADAAEKRANDAEKKAKDRERIKAAKQRVRDLKARQRDAKKPK